MPNMVILVLDDVDRLDDVIVAWRRAGSRGVTILESSGMVRRGIDTGRDDLPMFPGVSSLLAGREVHHRTLFTVLDDEVNIDAFFAATEAVLGPLDSHHSGIIFAVPVSHARGLHRDMALKSKAGQQ